MKKFASLIAAVAFATTSVFAATNYDLGEIELGKTYTIPSSVEYGTITATLTPTRSGALTMTGLGGCIEFFPTEDHAEDTQLPREWVQGSFGPDWACIYQVEENTTYYLYAPFVMLFNGNTVVFEMADDIEISLVETYPQAGTPVNTLTNNTGEILLVFNTGVVYNNSYLEAAGTKAQAGTGILDPSRQLAINIKSALNTLYASGALSADGGDMFTLCVEGIKASDSNVYGADGTIKINFINAGKLPELVGTNFSNSRPLKSYYPAGDPDGILEFTFDKPLKAQNGVFTLMIADDLKVEAELIGEDETGEPQYSETTYVVMTLPETLDTEGVYTLSIPEKVFMIGSQFDTSYNSALTVVYTVLGNGSISGVMVETAPIYDVYTVSGVRVMHTTSAAELSRLQRGIYIINGKKVAVK